MIARGGALTGTVAGNTNLIGGVIAALDRGYADSGRLTLRTGTLSVANIADSANSLNYGFGLSFKFNDIFNEGVEGAEYPVFDGYYGSTGFAQDTRATIGSGNLIVDYGAVPADLNRDITQSQVVTKDRATGFSLYLDVAAGVELYNLVDGVANGRNGRSVILQGVSTLVNDPLAPIRAIRDEIRSFSDDDRRNGKIELFLDSIDSRLPGFVVREEARQVPEFAAALAAVNVLPDGTVLTVEDKGLITATLQQNGAFAASAVVEKNFNAIGRDLNLDPVEVKRFQDTTNAFVQRGDASPAAKAAYEQAISEIVVTACRQPCSIRSISDPKVQRLFSSVVVATERVGAAVNALPPSWRTAVSYGLTALGGLKGVGQTLLAAAAPQGVQDVLAAADRAIVSGEISIVRSESFDTIFNIIETDRATNNQGAGFGVLNTLVGFGGLLKAVTNRRQPPNNNRNNDSTGCSFHGDTFVKTLIGMTPIKDIQPGKDKVWARDSLTGEMGYGVVERQITSDYEVTVRAEVRDSETGALQTIVSNTIHPYFVQLPQGASAPPSSERHVYDGKINRGAWVDAANLKPGYRLLNDDGSWAEVTGLQTEQAPLKAYNLTITGYHTFFVSGNAVANPVWVHNNNCGIDAQQFERELVNLPPGERVARVRATLREVAEANGDNGLVTVRFRSPVCHYATKAKGLMPPRNEWRRRAL